MKKSMMNIFNTKGTKYDVIERIVALVITCVFGASFLTYTGENEYRIYILIVIGIIAIWNLILLILAIKNSKSKEQ